MEKEAFGDSRTVPGIIRRREESCRACGNPGGLMNAGAGLALAWQHVVRSGCLEQPIGFPNEFKEKLTWLCSPTPPVNIST